MEQGPSLCKLNHDFFFTAFCLSKQKPTYRAHILTHRAPFWNGESAERKYIEETITPKCSPSRQLSSALSTEMLFEIVGKATQKNGTCYQDSMNKSPFKPTASTGSTMSLVRKHRLLFPSPKSYI